MRAVNLLPVDERAGARAVATGRLNPLHAIAGVGAVVIVVLLGMWAMARHDASTAREAEAAATARTATAQAQVSRLQPVVALDRRRESRETAVVALAQGRTDWAMVLQSVAGALPRQVGITQLSAQAVGATASGSGGTVPAGLGGQGSVAINGCADTQRRVARTLVALRRLPQVADVALNQTSDGSKGASASSASSGAASGGCRKVTMDAALGLAPTTTLDLVPTAATATAAGGATETTPNGTTSTPDNATQAAAGGTNGAGR
jgi:Tfp pilus assembly protein PilN